MRVIGIDFGTKTIGLAVSDELGLTAQGMTTLQRRGLKQDISQLKALSETLQADSFVVGMPWNMNGTEGARAKETRHFGAMLQAKTRLNVIYQDERLTTVAAERILLEANLTRKKRRKIIDQVAASIILQAWLDAQQRAS